MDTNLVLTIISLSLALLFGIFAVFSHFSHRKYKEFSYFRRTHQVIETNATATSKLKLSYDGKDIKDFSITKYAIWNSGNEMLNGNNIVEAEPLTISSKWNSIKILDAKIIGETEEANGFKICESDIKSVKLEFDYANKKDGIVIQILHNGKASYFNVNGKIKGGENLKNTNTDFNITLRPIVSYCAIPWSITLLLLGIFVIAGIATFRLLIGAIIGIGLISTVFVSVYIVGIVSKKREPFPTKLRKYMKYEEDDD